MCGAKCSAELSEEQLFRYFLSGYGGFMNESSAMTVKTGPFAMSQDDSAKGIAMLRQAFDENKVFRISFIEGEGVVTDGNHPGPPHFEMELSDTKYDYLNHFL